MADASPSAGAAPGVLAPTLGRRAARHAHQYAGILAVPSMAMSHLSCGETPTCSPPWLCPCMTARWTRLWALLPTRSGRSRAAWAPAFMQMALRPPC